MCSLIGRRFAKKQQMQWTPTGAHKLLQIRVKAANGDLPSTFQGGIPISRLPTTKRRALLRVLT